MGNIWFSRTDTGFRGWFQAVRSTGALRTGAASGSFTFLVVSPDDSGSQEFFVSESQQKSGLYFADIQGSYLLASGTGDYGVSVEVDIPTPQSITDAFSSVLHVTQDDWDSLRDLVIIATEYQRSAHSAETYLYVDPVSGSNNNDGLRRATAKQTIANALSAITEEHTAVIVLGEAGGQQVISENITLSTRYTFLRGPGLDVQLIGAVNSSPTINITAEGCEVAGFEVTTLGTGTPDAIQVSADFARLKRLRIVNPRRHAINCLDGDRLRLDETIIEGAGQSGTGNGILLSGSSFALIDTKTIITSGSVDGILVDPGAGTASDNIIDDCTITNSQNGFGISVLSGSSRTRLTRLSFSGNSSGDINDGGSETVVHDTVLDNYEGIIHIDTSSGFTNLSYPNGTLEVPIDNYSDARTIADANGIQEFNLINGVLTLTSSLTEWSMFGKTLEAEVALNSQSINSSRFTGLKLTGIMSGTTSVNNGVLEGVDNFVGFAQFCGFSGNVSLGVGESTFDQCHSQEPGTGLPTLDFVGAGRSANVRSYSGGIKIENMTDSTNSGTIEFVAGRAVVDSSCTAGELVLRGVVEVVDNSAGTTVITEAALARSPIADVVWDESASAHNVTGTMGYLQNQIVDGIMSGTGVNVASSSIDDIVNAVWEEPLPGEHDVADTAGKLLQTAGTGGVDVDVLAAAVWDRLASAHTTTGTMGELQNQSEIIRALMENSWELIGSQMVFYANDGVTPFRIYNLFETDSSPFFSEEGAPAERVLTGSLQ